VSGQKHCQVCDQEDSTWELYAKGIPEGEGSFQLLRCRNCGFGWTDPAPAAHEIGKWYPQVYYGKGNVRFHWALEWLVRIFRQRRASEVTRRTIPGSVLDVGCGRGLILGTLKGKGYMPYGVEISDHAAWHARTKMGVNVHVGDFMAAPYKPGLFEAVIFWHSLEHVLQPVKAIRHAAMLLKPGGLLVVAVPNSESLQARLTGRNWFHLDIPRHYFHFGTASLRKTMEDAGFRIVNSAHFSFEQNPYGWLQSLYNALGFDFNFLYNWIKNSSSRLVPLREYPLQSLLTLALMPILVPIALLLTIIEALAKRGGTIELYAVKK
jgi:2-polyprenyl-3-methyl-5-hydroxy-6-metoxy-1,4-benzoquinol methylase